MRNIMQVGTAVLLIGLIGCGSTEEEHGSEHEGTSEHDQVGEHDGAGEHDDSDGHDSDGEHAGSEEHGPGEDHDETPAGDSEANAKPVIVEGDWVAGDTIPSGKPGVPDIQILEVHANGTGPVCGTGKRATLEYKAMNADGLVLDPGTKPYTFKVDAGQAIAGWDIVVAKMRVGDSFTLILPEDLAYGASRGDLTFDMKLIEIH